MPLLNTAEIPARKAHAFSHGLFTCFHDAEKAFDLWFSSNFSMQHLNFCPAKSGPIVGTITFDRLRFLPVMAYVDCPCTHADTIRLFCGQLAMNNGRLWSELSSDLAILKSNLEKDNWGLESDFQTQLLGRNYFERTKGRQPSDVHTCFPVFVGN